MVHRKPIEDYNLIDDYLMTSVAANPEVGEPYCRKLLSVLLQRDISRVHVVPQRVIPGNNTDLRGIRMDVEVEEFSNNNGKEIIANVYDIEPHTKNDLDFPRHNRFYQSKIDIRHMKKGENDFSKLPNLYVITITNFDLFNKDYMMYTFRNKCIEAPETDYPDGLTFVYFNTKGHKGGSQAIENMLKYIQESKSVNANDDATKEIDGYVKHVKEDPLWKEAAMTLGYYFDQEREEGRIEGREEGRIESRIEDILELLEDLGPVSADIRDRLYEINDTDELKRLHKLAAKSEDMAAFINALPQHDTVNV